MVKNQGKVHTAISVSSEVFKYADAYKVCTIDSKAVSTDTTKYCESNVFQYYVAINTWLLQIKCICGDRASYSVSCTIKRCGLIQTIDDACKLASSMVNYNQGGEKPMLPTGWFMPNIFDLNLQDVLQALRYLKRFTPHTADKLSESTLKKFREINRWDKASNYTVFPTWLTSSISKYLGEMLQYFNEEYASCLPKFSSGSTTHGKVLSSKLSEYSLHCKYWLDPMYPIGDPRQVYDPYPFMPVMRFSPTITPVPKNYKTYRLIAPENPYYAAEKQRIKDAMRRSIARTRFAKQYTPDDQGVNRERAFIGSRDGIYATIDLSSASDSICEAFAYDVLPFDFTEVVRRYMCPLIKVGNDVCYKRMFATSGDPVCFDTESFIFLAICMTVKDICEHLTGESYEDPTVYGDDIVVDSRMFDSVIDILNILRFIPNGDKSYGVGGYRESCGVEYYYGYEVTTDFWPRKVVLHPDKDIESLQSLTSLEHKLFPYWEATKYLIDVILAIYPKMTASLPGSECDDLWADSPWAPLRSAPFKKDTGSTPDPLWTRREAHTTFTTDKVGSDKWSRDMDMYHYANFLAYGPMYASPLDEILGVSMPTTRTTDFGIPKTVVKIMAK